MQGKKVDVFFSHADALFGVTVKHVPQDVGDSWHLVEDNGREHCVVIFECMSECTPKSSEEHSAQRRACSTQSTSTNTAKTKCLCKSCMQTCYGHIITEEIDAVITKCRKYHRMYRSGTSS